MAKSTPTPAVVDDLKRQHDYVENLRKRGEDAFALVSPEAFLRGIRDLGYRSTLTAIDELIDNAVQANAHTVWVFPAYKKENKGQRKPDAIVVVDDGHGMEPDMIRIAVRWGGTHRENDRSGFGRYGFGLPSSCVSIGQKYTVYSKVTGGNWNAVEIDVKKVSEDIAKGEKVDAKAEKRQPPAFVSDKVNVSKFGAGTVIVIENLDRLDAGFKTTQALVRNLMEHIGVQYRKMMPQVRFVVDETPVEAVGPLFLDENGRWYNESPVKAQAVPSIEFEVEGQSGEKGMVRIRAASFPFNFHLRDPDGPVVSSNHNARYRIMKEYNGIMVCRAGRQIDTLTRIPVRPPERATIVNFDRFWAVEIDFDPVLDEYFGVTTNKQQIVFSESIIDHLSDHGFGKLIKDLRARMRDSRNTVLAALEKRNKAKRTSETSMETAKKHKPRTSTPTPEQAKKADENLLLQAKKRAEVTGEPVEKEKERLAAEVRERPYKVDFESMPDGPIFRPERLGPQYRLVLNTSHRFYSDLYEPAEKVPGLRSRLEALLFVFAEAELDSSGDREKFYRAERVYSSQRLADVLAEVDETGDTEDAASADMEEHEVATPAPAEG